MAVRKPVYITGDNNIQEMTTAEVLEWTNQVCYLYGTSPSVTLTVSTSVAGDLTAMSDTRMKAGATSQSATAFPNEATTAEPAEVTVSYDRVDQAKASVSPTSDTGTTWPLYINGDNDLQAMTIADVKDTLLHPAIDLLISGTESATTAGTYTITTSATPASNYAVVSTDPVFIDTRADTAAFTAGGIPETLDQPTTITSYYLHKRSGTDTAPARYPVYITDSVNHLQTFTEGTFDGLLTEWIRETASESSDGYQLSYTIETSGSGNTRGTAMVNTKLNGSGAHSTRQVGDDYRAQEFPNGAAVTVSTYNLRINKG
jgi:hypothetical protein